MSHVKHKNEHNVATHIWLSHVPKNEPCHTHEGILSHTLTSSTSWHTNDWVTSLLRWNKTCRTYEWIMSHTSMSRTSRKTSYWVMLLLMSHVTHMNESCYRNERASCHDTPIIYHVPTMSYMNESCRTHEQAAHVTTHIELIHVTTKQSWHYVNESWHPTNACLRSDGSVNKRQPLARATLCNTLQHTTIHLCTDPTRVNSTLQHSATLCNTLQRSATIIYTDPTRSYSRPSLPAKYCRTHAHYNTRLQHTATLCNTLQHTTAPMHIDPTPLL